VKNQITQDVFLDRAVKPLRKFMLAQTKEAELNTALKIGKVKDKLKSADEVPLHLLTVAFMLGELKAAFQIGFMLFLPFVIIDLLVSSALVSVGLMFLPPTTLSLPFKIILFVLVDGWNILCEGLVNSFQVVN
jgi:flagellar biosynthetic protein FliP